MSKRKSDASNIKNGDDQGEEEKRCSKKERITSDSDDVISAAISQAKLASRRGVNTLKLITAMKSKESVLKRTQAVGKLLKDLAKNQPEDQPMLLDMSARKDEDDAESKPALFLLFGLMYDCLPEDADDANSAQERSQADTLLDDTVNPLLSRLLLSFDPLTTDAETGNNALHELGRLFVPTPDNNIGSWTELLIQRGVSVHDRNLAGRTPLLEAAVSAASSHDSAFFVRLLQQFGTDINAQDDDGDSLLHLLVYKSAFDVLEDLFAEGDASELDFALRNNHGQTVADLAAIRHAEQNSKITRQMRNCIRMQMQMWRKHVRPVILKLLSQPMIPDLAELTIEYIDGSGEPFEEDLAAEDA